MSKLIWIRNKFDIEGIAGAGAAWLASVFLGWLWPPLFWIGAILVILILLATRSQTRVSPDLANLVVAPCDGIVHSVERALPPTELRLQGGEWLRLRIASSPFTTNRLYACLNGEIASVILEEPDASVFVASHPNTPGLAVAHVALESLGKQIGCTVSTGGLGPRLEMVSEAGDPVRLGRIIGKRRLGGWCDVYLASDTKLLVQEGQTLIGAETVLCRLLRTADREAPDGDEVEDTVNEATPASGDLELIGAVVADEPSALETLGEAVTGEEVGAATAPDETDNAKADVEEITGDNVGEPEDAVAALFKKLKNNENAKD